MEDQCSQQTGDMWAGTRLGIFCWQVLIRPTRPERPGSPSDTRSQGHLHKSGEEEAWSQDTTLQTAASHGQNWSKHRGTDLSSGTPLRLLGQLAQSSFWGFPGWGRRAEPRVWEEHRHSRLISLEHRYKLPFENISKVNMVLQGTNNYLWASKDTIEQQSQDHFRNIRTAQHQELY